MENNQDNIWKELLQDFETGLEKAIEELEKRDFKLGAE